MMTLDDYQKEASTTMLPQCRDLNYLGLGLAGETGEVCDKLKRLIRGDGRITDDLLFELGDVLWYISQLASFLNVDLSEVAQMNIEKLETRKKKELISGTGDHR